MWKRTEKERKTLLFKGLQVWKKYVDNLYFLCGQVCVKIVDKWTSFKNFKIDSEFL